MSRLRWHAYSLMLGVVFSAMVAEYNGTAGDKSVHDLEKIARVCIHHYVLAAWIVTFSHHIPALR